MKQKLLISLFAVILIILCVRLLIDQKRIVGVAKVPVLKQLNQSSETEAKRDSTMTQAEDGDETRADHPRKLQIKADRPGSEVTKQPTGARCKSKQNNVVFLKVHKCGSSTVANILQRYTENNDLNALLPNKSLTERSFWVLHRFRKEYMSQIIPIPKGETYNTMFVHTVYDRDIFKKLFPSDSYYVAILRDPVERFVSYSFYYGVIKQIKADFPESKDNLYIFSNALLKTPFPYVAHQLGPSYDLGYSSWAPFNKSKVDEFIHNIDADYDFVMIMEYFDESLIYLRRHLCWDIKDIIYIKRNVNERKTDYALSQTDREAIRSLQPTEVHLYDYFFKKFWNTMKKQPVDFFEEVYNFKKILKAVTDYCNFGSNIKATADFAKTKFHAEFTITNADCSQMKRKEHEAISVLANKARKKYQQSLTL